MMLPDGAHWIMSAVALLVGGVFCRNGWWRGKVILSS